MPLQLCNQLNSSFSFCTGEYTYTCTQPQSKWGERREKLGFYHNKDYVLATCFLCYLAFAHIFLCTVEEYCIYTVIQYCCWYIKVCKCRQQRIEQERRDRELALRLAQEDQSQVEELPGRSVYIVSLWLWWIILLADLVLCHIVIFAWINCHN